MKMPVRPILFMLCLSAVPLSAQLAAPSPLMDESVAAQGTPGEWIIEEGRADAALHAGFPATAAVVYRAILDNPVVPPATAHRVTLSLVTALMDAGEPDAAEKTLEAYTGAHNTPYQLRVGLLAITAGRLAPARAALAAGRIEDLTAADRSWWYFLQAMVADAEGEITAANNYYEQAADGAVSELQRVRFLLGQEQSRLRAGQVAESQLAALRGNMERFQGTRLGYTAVRTYAAALAGLDRAAEAQAVLQRQLAVLPPTERDAADQLGLMLGLIAGENSGAGRQAFKQLLREGLRPDTQRLALQLLARGAKTPEERRQLRRDLSELINAPTPHAIIEDLLLARAQTALADKDYTPAEEDARALLERFPASASKPAALGVRLVVAWESKRYRTAADVIVQLRAVVPPGIDRSELGVLLAEAWFRAGADAEARGADGKGEFRNAVDAYEAALREPPAVVPAGTLIFQRVLADIRADQLDAAAAELDAAAATPGFAVESRWQAEWNLIREMQARGQMQAAQDRVNRLLAGGAQGVSEELRIRLIWLRAKLAFDNGQPELAQQQADELLTALKAGGEMPMALRTDVTSMGQLLKARALLALNREQEGFALFEQLRTNYRATPAAQYSYLVQAGYQAQRGDMAGAQGLLISFVDREEYKKSEYAPLALYEAALNLERQGLDRQFQEAYRLLERLVSDYPRDELVFYARLKQGDLQRKLTDFSTARQLYEDLTINYSQHPDVLLAWLALAESLFAQGTNSVVNYERARDIFARLRDLPAAPVDLRVEAGYKWGNALARRGQAAKALTVFWSVVDTFLLDAGQAAKLGANGRWWLSKSLLQFAQLHEESGRFDEAQRAYQIIVNNQLNGAALAEAKLARFRTKGEPRP